MRNTLGHNQPEFVQDIVCATLHSATKFGAMVLRLWGLEGLKCDWLLKKETDFHEVHLPQRASYTSAQLGHMEDQLGSMVMLTHNDCPCLSHVQKLKWLIWVSF